MTLAVPNSSQVGAGSGREISKSASAKDKGRKILSAKIFFQNPEIFSSQIIPKYLNPLSYIILTNDIFTEDN